MLNKLQITKQLTSSLRNSVISVPCFIMNYSFSEVEKTSDERVTLLKKRLKMSEMSSTGQLFPLSPT